MAKQQGDKSLSSFKKGMNRDKAEFDLTNSEYSFMLNGNFQDEHGSGDINLQNEPSNIYCSGFKEGFKVVGHKFDINEDKTYFFLTNPTTGCSEIGYISSFHNFDGVEQLEETCGCNISVILENPLEDQVKVATCEYNTIISDYCALIDECTGCLGFSIDYPIHESNIHLKDENSGRVLYWTDFNKPQRYLQLDRLYIYTQDVDDCTGEVVRTCLNCDKMRIFKLFDKPCLEVSRIQNGGNLRGGMYEVLISYCTQTGDEISDYYALTNPIPIFDENNNILDQTNLDYLTNQSIRINVTDLDDKYEYYKIAVIYRNGLDGAISAKEQGIYPIGVTSISISTLNDKKVLRIIDLLGRRVVYEKARGMASGNGYLFQYGLEAHREVNLQRVVNLLGSMVKWSTVQAEEDIYKDGAHVSNYLSYMRDEVVPLSIRFFKDGGYETATFPFIPRPPKTEEIEVLGVDYAEDDNNASILEYNPDCNGNERDKRWQFENTAEILGNCVVPAGPTDVVTVEVEETASCFVTDIDGNLAPVYTVLTGTVDINGNNSLIEYINANQALILASTDPAWVDVQIALNGPYTETCVPDFGANCADPTRTLEEIIAISVGEEVEENDSIAFEDYSAHPTAPEDCDPYGFDVSTGVGTPVEDTTFMATYMRDYTPQPGETVYFRNNVPGSSTCPGNTVVQYAGSNPPLISVANTVKFNYSGALGSTGGTAALQLSQNITSPSGIDLPNGFTSKLHSNVRWFKIDWANFSGLSSILLELSPASSPLVTDDICQDAYRVTVYADCGGATDVNSVIITDATLVNDPNKQILLEAADFPSGLTYIAIDTPINVDALWKITLVDNGAVALDTIDITIDNLAGAPVVYNAIFATDLTTTAANFVSDEAANILSAHDIIVTSVGEEIFFRSLESQYTTAIVNNFSGGLEGTLGSPAEETYHTLRPVCGCFAIFYRAVELRKVISFTDLVFGKRDTFTSLCEYQRPSLKGCDPIPYEYGLFSYWESIERYPCTEELWDSSGIKIFPTDLDSLSVDEKAEFIDYYTNSGALDTDGSYLLVNADFRDQPIRHYKFPCSVKVPFMSTQGQNPGSFKESVIYPIGFSISNSAINTFLDLAVSNNLLTFEERAKITKYEIFRGDRSVDKSVIAKGLLFDMYRHVEEGGLAYYPNYPLNSLGNDQLNGGIAHIYGSNKNNKFTFHSPDTSFHKPSLPQEMKVEGYQFGASGVYFDKVKDYPTYVILGDKAYELATGLAVAEVVLDLLVQGLGYTLEGITAGTVFGAAGGIILAVVIILALIGAMFRVGKLRYEWLETIRNLGHPHDFAYYSATLGHYNYFMPNSEPTSVSRGLAKITYLNEGRVSVPNEVSGESLNINNLDRETSVFANLGDSFFIDYPSLYASYDNTNSPIYSSRARYHGTGRSGRMERRAASPYASLKQYLPAQYGSIQSVDWVHTGFCGDTTDMEGCNPIFGGDTYISRFSLKRKFTFFTANSHGLAPRTPFKHSDYFNVNPLFQSSRYFLDYMINDDNDNYFMMFVFPDNKSKIQLDSIDPDYKKVMYIKPPAKFYVYSYGIPYFLVESTINCNFRYAKRERHENFYPNVGDLINFTQESNVSIREPNTYFYNHVYSGLRSKYPWRMLPDNYNEELYRGLTNLTNTIIYSQQDNSEASLTDPWLLYRALDAYTFPKTFGKLIDMDSIESEAILARFENGVTLFGAIDQLRDRMTAETQNIGSGGIFSGRSVNFNKTDLGYGGTQHVTKVSCEFGHFWADAKRGQVFHMKPNGEGFNEITSGLQKWFKENLPFKISQYVPGLEQEDLDNTFKGIGLTMGWDSSLKRVFLTKLDYKPLRTDIKYNGANFYYENEKRENVIIEVQDPEFFKDCSFTVAFSPLTATWISYYSFKPNYYISYNNYFQTGVNYSVDSSEEGLWSHLPFLSSYQVFYGNLHPWIIEGTLVSKFTNSSIEDIEYWMEVRKYYSKYNFSNVFGYGFNKAFIYNSQQNSGQLNLVHQKGNDLSQEIAYPKHNLNSTDILQSEISGKWSFNYLYNTIKNERNGLPIWIYDCNQIMKTLDDRLLDYRSSYKDRLRGDYFILRLQQDQESRFKMIYRFNADDRNYYEQ